MKEAKWCDPKKAEKEGKMPWRTLKDALRGLDDPKKEHGNFSQGVARYLRYVPPGGCWINIPKKMQRDAMGGAADDDHPDRKGKQGGRRGFYRRLAWDSPSPTLVTSPSQLGTCLCHPDETRPLSVKEYARIQGFPDGWEFVGTTSQKYRMIGEAVPVDLARAIGKPIMKVLNQS
jgi:DNA (cytosine-5)-methyltransferase 1